MVALLRRRSHHTHLQQRHSSSSSQVSATSINRVSNNHLMLSEDSNLRHLRVTMSTEAVSSTSTTSAKTLSRALSLIHSIHSAEIPDNSKTTIRTTSMHSETTLITINSAHLVEINLSRIINNLAEALQLNRNGTTIISKIKIQTPSAICASFEVK